VPLLNYLKSPHAGIRSRAAEVVSTVVQNNPKSQQQVLDNQGLEYLLFNFTKDKDITSRTKALGAISSLIRHNKAGTAAFRLANGYAGLRDALSSEDPRFQRKALQLLQYLIQDNAKDASAASELGFMHSLISFASNPNADVRQAALHCLLEVARNCGDGEESTTPEETSALRKVLGDRIDEISRLNPEDLAALKEERHLVDALWQLLFHEPSKLRKEGLLGLPEDDETPPEVAVRSPSLLEASRIRPPDVAQAKDVPVLRLGI
jgi:hsp70-interacting protein